MRRPISIRDNLLRDVVVLVVFVAGAVFLTMLLGARRVARTSAEAITAVSLDAVEIGLRGFFEIPRRELEMLREQAESGLLEGDGFDPAGSRAAERRNRSLLPVLATSDRISSIQIADGDGNEHMLLRDGDAWVNRITRVEQWGDEVLVRKWSLFQPQISERRELQGYDPRRRPWFSGALAARDHAQGEGPVAHWTRPYEFFTSKEPGISGSVAYDLDDGVDRVVAVDVRLSDLTDYTRHLQIGRRGLAVVMTEDGRLLGLPGLDRFEDPQTRTAALLELPADVDISLFGDATAAHVNAEDWGVALPFRSGGETWWGQTRFFPLSPDRRLLIAVVVPESDLLGNLAMQRVIILVILCGLLGFAVWRAMVLARRFSAPVEALVIESDRIGRGDFEPGPPVVTRVTEVRRLARAFVKLRDGVQALMKLEKMERDLDIAREIQQGLLPRRPPDLAGIEVAGWSMPADKTGGDYYDWITLPDGGAAVTLADVTGHGIGPALIVAVCRAYLRASTTFGATRLSEALANVNSLLYEDTPPERFVTAAVAVINPEASRLTLASAGHGPLLFYEAATGTVHRWGADVPPLGVLEDIVIDDPREIMLAAGDLLVLTTDGFFEWQNPAGRQFGIPRLEAFVQEHHDLTPEQFIETLYREVLGHAEGTTQDDDLTAVVIRKL